MAIPVYQDIFNRRKELKAKEWLQENCPGHILELLEFAANKPWAKNADGIYYRDAKLPFIIADETSVTLNTTSLLLHTMQFSSLPANYFTPGKLVKLTLMGRVTTAATPGNFTYEIRYGTTSNAGTIIATGAAVAAAVNKTNITWNSEAYARCRLIGASGSLMSWGWVIPEPSAVILPAANNPYTIPITAPAATTVDTTAASGINLQLKRSGSTAETSQVHDVQFEALN